MVDGGGRWLWRWTVVVIMAVMGGGRWCGGETTCAQKVKGGVFPLSLIRSRVSFGDQENAIFVIAGMYVDRVRMYNEGRL